MRRSRGTLSGGGSFCFSVLPTNVAETASRAGWSSAAVPLRGHAASCGPAAASRPSLLAPPGRGEPPAPRSQPNPGPVGRHQRVARLFPRIDEGLDQQRAIDVARLEIPAEAAQAHPQHLRGEVGAAAVDLVDLTTGMAQVAANHHCIDLAGAGLPDLRQRSVGSVRRAPAEFDMRGHRLRALLPAARRADLLEQLPSFLFLVSELGAIRCHRPLPVLW